MSDGITWSPWSSPSSPVKVFVAPPKPVYLDSAKLGLQITGTNVRLGWTLLKAHCGLRLVEYSVFVREVLHDCSDICPKRIAWQDIHAAHKDGETLSCELRDLRQDVSYVFTLAARYPNVGPREFEDALSSPPTSLRHVCGPLPVPMQIHLPGDRLRRMQVARVVLLRWSMKGLKHPGIDADPGEKAYELQVLPEGAAENQWLPCSGVQRMRVDGHTAWHVKDLPEHALRCPLDGSGNPVAQLGGFLLRRERFPQRNLVGSQTTHMDHCRVNPCVQRDAYGRGGGASHWSRSLKCAFSFPRALVDLRSVRPCECVSFLVSVTR